MSSGAPPPGRRGSVAVPGPRPNACLACLACVSKGDAGAIGRTALAALQLGRVSMDISKVSGQIYNITFNFFKKKET